jgi:hypothetical protein
MMDDETEEMSEKAVALAKKRHPKYHMELVGDFIHVRDPKTGDVLRSEEATYVEKFLFGLITEAEDAGNARLDDHADAVAKWQAELDTTHGLKIEVTVLEARIASLEWENQTFKEEKDAGQGEWAIQQKYIEALKEQINAKGS